MSEINIKRPGQILDYVDTKENLLKLFNYITNLKKENQQPCNEIDIWNDKYNAVDRDRKKYKCVLDEIKEQLKLERKLALSLNKPYTVSVIDKLLDKVKDL